MSKSIRIGIDARLYEETGVGRYVRNLIAHLAKIDKVNHYFLFLRKKTYDTIVLPGRNFSKVLADVRWHTPREQIIIPYLLQKNRLELVHFPYQNFTPTLFYPGKYVLTVHDLTIRKLKTGRMAYLPWPLPKIKQYFFHFFLTLAVKRACHVITVSEAVKRDLLKVFPGIAGQTSVIYEASELEVKLQYKTAEQEIAPFFLYVGSAHPHKNLNFLIKAFSKAAIPGTKLVLAGDDDFFYPRLHASLNKKEQDLVQILGKVSDGRLINLYRHARALVFPTLGEGFGLPALEAMACGCLVVASRVPALREVCGESAVYFDPNSEQELASLLRRVVTGRESFAKYVESGKKRAQMFSWTRMAKETYSIYENCLGLRSGQ